MSDILNPMGNLFSIADMESRSACPENIKGEKGKGAMAQLGEGTATNAARDLGLGWKVNPYLHIEPGETIELLRGDLPDGRIYIAGYVEGQPRFDIVITLTEI